MRLKPNLPPTNFSPPRGLGGESIPDVGEQTLESSRWWTRDELMAAPGLSYAPGGLFLGRIDQKMVGLPLRSHLLTCGASQSGKSTASLVPNLMIASNAALILDPKGQLAEMTARHRAETLGHTVRILDPYAVLAAGDLASFRCGHDPLRELDITRDDFIDDAMLMAEALIVEGGGDNHWVHAARELILSLILFARLCGDRHLADMRDALARDPAALWVEMAALESSNADAAPVRRAIEIIQGYGEGFPQKNEREAASIISTALVQLAFLQSLPMRELQQCHDVDLAQLKTGDDGRTLSLYVVLPASKMESMSRWLRLLISQALTQMERVAERPLHPVILLCEEFPALGRLRAVEQAVGYIAGFGVCIWIVIQSLSQLKALYRDSWETFLGNACVVQAFGVADQTTAKYLSDCLGQTTVEVTNKIAANAQMLAGGDHGFRREFRTVPLMTPAELAIEFARKPGGGVTLVLVPGAHPFAVDRVHYEELQP